MSKEGLKYYLKHPKQIYGFFASRGMLNWVSDKAYLKMVYKNSFGKKLNLKNPQTFNEKLQWLKLYNRKDIYTAMVDKYQVKKLITDKIGADYIIPTINVYDKFEDINLDELPNQFVLKCTHDSGGLVICKDKSCLDLEKAKKKIKKSLKVNYFWLSREWPYKNVKPRIIAEEFVGEISNSLVVYKVFCFNGTAKIIQVIQGDKTKQESIDYFDDNWNLLDLRQNYPNSLEHLPKPQLLDEMLKLSGELSKGYPFLRVDWYIVNNKLKFSEFTFYSDSGLSKFYPDEWDLKLGEMIKLDKMEK